MRWIAVALVLAPLANGTAIARPIAAPTLIVRGDRLYVPVTIDGQTVEALLDSAAEASILDDGFAKVLGLTLEGGETVKGSGGREKVRFAKGISMQAVGTDLPDRTVAVLDLDPLSDRLLGTKVQMILGRDLFDAGRFEIDIARGSIRKLTDSEKPAGTELALTTVRGIETLSIAIEGRPPIQAAFDLGNGSEMMVGREAAVKMRLAAPYRIIERKTGGGLGGAVLRDIVLLTKVTIAGRDFAGVRAAIDDQQSQSDANVGVSVLRNFVIVTDFPGHKLWLRPH